MAAGGIMGMPMPGYIMPMPGYMKENMPAWAAAAMPRSRGFIMGSAPKGFIICAADSEAALRGPTPGIDGRPRMNTCGVNIIIL